MKNFGRDQHGHNSPWDGSPAWARELREMALVAMAQNDVLIEMVSTLKVQMSPEDQKVMDKIYNQAVAIKKKIDDAGVE